MPTIDGSYLIHYKTANMGTSDSSTPVGGAPTSTVVETTDTIGLFSYRTVANALGGATKFQYESTDLRNTHPTDTAVAPSVYIENSCDDNTGVGVITLTSDSSSENLVAYAYGIDQSNNPFMDTPSIAGTVAGNGTTTAKTAGFGRIEFRDPVNQANFKNNVGNITITCGAQVLGVIPAGYHSATFEVTVAIVASLGTSGTVTNPVTAPGGLTFSKPRTSGGALAFAGDLPAGQWQQLWWRLAVLPGIYKSGDTEIGIVFQAS